MTLKFLGCCIVCSVCYAYGIEAGAWHIAAFLSFLSEQKPEIIETYNNLWGVKNE